MNPDNPIIKFASTKSPALGSTTPTGDNPLLQHAKVSSMTPSTGATSTAMKTLLGPDAAHLPQTVDDARKLQDQNPSLWQRISKQLMKPIGLVATAAEETGRVIGDAATGGPVGQDLYNIPGKLGGILTGTRTRSFTDVFKENWDAVKVEDNDGQNVGANFWNDGIPNVIGLITDIAADPLNFIGGGLTKTGELADKVSALTKAGETIAADSKLAKEMKALGFTADMLKLAPTKAEQVQQGQRALLSVFGNTRWEKTIYGGEKIYESAKVFGDGIKGSTVGQFLGKVFSTKTANEAFNATKEHFTNLLQYRQGEVMNEAMDIQKSIGTLAKEDAQRVIDVIETGKKSGVEAIDTLASRIDGNLKTIKKSEEGLGLLKTDLQFYFPHSLKDAGAVEKTGWQKFKSMFYDAGGQFVADKAGEGYGDAKLFSTKLDSSTARKYEGTISEIKKNFGIEFDDRAAVAYAKRALGSAKAVTSKEFFESTKQFALNKAEGLTKEALNYANFEDFAKAKGVVGEAPKLLPDLTKASLDVKRDAVAEALKKLTSNDFVSSSGKLALDASGEVDDILMKIEKGTDKVSDINKAMEILKTIETKSAKVATRNELTRAFEESRAIGEKSAIGVETKVKELKGMKFSPDVARQIDQYYQAVKPEEINIMLKKFDAVQNWWKAQALTAPSYHIRNMAGNLWNNFLAGVTNPDSYFKAGALQLGKSVEFTDDAGRVWNTKTLIDAAKKTGVINEGWYAKDIETALTSEMGGLSWNPMKQNFALYRGNRAVGSMFENNGRLAHFIDKIKTGESIDNAAMSVKKYLFDYGDLTFTEKNLFKRVVPFYSWTRKNIPLQLEKLITQPEKFAGIAKVKNTIESNVEKPNEKYLGDYIRDNVGMRVGTDKKGNTMYFLLGNWLPSAQAIDFLSQPTQNFIQSVSPFFKTPVELWANKSTFFEDTFGQPSKIERYPQENQSFLGFTMRKKTAYILKNVRILNELDKLNPGSIFGDKETPALSNRIAPDAGFSLPFGIGHVTTSSREVGKYVPDTSQPSRILQSMFGKAVPYNPQYAKQFYLWDTKTKVEELKTAIKGAQRDGQSDYAKRLNEELKATLKSRK